MVANEKMIGPKNSSRPPGPLIYLILLLLTVGLLVWLNQAGKDLRQNQGVAQPSPSLNLVELVFPPAENNEPQDDPQIDNSQEANDQGAVGSLNHQYLQSDAFTKLVVEIDSVEGTSPNGSAVNTLLATIEQYADKPAGIMRSGDNQFAAEKDSYTASDLVNLISQHRQQYTSGNSIGLYVLYLNGDYADRPSALGVAINASTMVIFKDQINSATTALVQGPAIERAVLVHELGHLLGLINLTYQSEKNHEDLGHPGHSSSSQSVMFWAVEDVNISNILAGGPPYQFDDDDQFDLAKIKAGEY